MNDFISIEFRHDKLVFIDQTKLPLQEEYIETENVERIAEAIERLEIRGAPAIGVATAYALALSKKNVVGEPKKTFNDAYLRLAKTRPTAVNLFRALDEMKQKYEQCRNDADIYNQLLNKAKEIHQDDIDKCKAIGENGSSLLSKGSTILTHCNTGQLATGGNGTAFNIIKKGYEYGLVDFVYADETRPLLQGSRLTAFELSKAGIPFKILSDSSAAFLMTQKKIDAVIVGADRIAKNGDTANKIGTYNLAVLCKYHDIPFYIAAPTTTIDLNCKSGNDIKIEMRDKMELIKINDVQITNADYDVYTPAFDITPFDLITAIVTEEKINKPPYKL